jgi:hypothetical protein
MVKTSVRPSPLFFEPLHTLPCYTNVLMLYPLIQTSLKSLLVEWLIR